MFSLSAFIEADNIVGDNCIFTEVSCFLTYKAALRKGQASRSRRFRKTAMLWDAFVLLQEYCGIGRSRSITIID